MLHRMIQWKGLWWLSRSTTVTVSPKCLIILTTYCPIKLNFGNISFSSLQMDSGMVEERSFQFGNQGLANRCHATRIKTAKGNRCDCWSNRTTRYLRWLQWKFTDKPSSSLSSSSRGVCLLRVVNHKSSFLFSLFFFLLLSLPLSLSPSLSLFFFRERELKKEVEKDKWEDGKNTMRKKMDNRIDRALYVFERLLLLRLLLCHIWLLKSRFTFTISQFVFQIFFLCFFFHLCFFVVNSLKRTQRERTTEKTLLFITQ